MSLSYLAEHADAARIALALAEREAAHLRYTHRTLYAEPIDIAWVQALAEREDLAEKIDAFVGRFGRLQDHIGEKLLPAFARLLGGQPRCRRVFRTDGMGGERRRVYRRAKASQLACARIHDRARAFLRSIIHGQNGRSNVVPCCGRHQDRSHNLRPVVVGADCRRRQMNRPQSLPTPSRHPLRRKIHSGEERARPGSSDRGM